MKYNLVKIRELIYKALTPDDLENLLSDEFRPIYDNCYGQNRGYKIRELVDYANRQVQIEKLLRLVKDINRNRYDEYQHQIYNCSDRQNSLPQISRSHKPSTVSNFDLQNTIDPCVQRIRLCKRGLMGLSVGCNDDSFLHNFRERLEEELDGRDIKIYPPIVVSHRNPVKTVVNKVSSLKKNLKIQNIVYPIKIDNNSKSVTTELWTEIQNINFVEEFKLDRHLTIVMFGDRDCIFPSDMQSLEPPRFTTTHAYNWIRNMTAFEKPSKEWIEARDKWTEKITEDCLCEDPDVLDVGWVYLRLMGTFSFLQKNSSISPQSFLEFLE